MPFSWAFVRPALLASGHKKTTELVDSPWFVLIKPTFVRLGCGKTGIRTLGTRKGTTVFETVPIDHSGIFPIVVDGNGNRTAALMRSQRYERFLALRKFLTVKIPYLCP